MVELDATITRRQLASRWGVGASRSSSVEEIAGRILAFPALDPNTLALSLWARTSFERISDAIDALKESTEHTRSMVGIFAMRRAMHLVHRIDMGMMLAVYGERFGPSKTRFALDALVSAGLCDMQGAQALYDALCEKILSAIGDVERSTADILSEIPDIRGRAMLAAGKPYQIEVDIGECLIESMVVSGRLICARRCGSSFVGAFRWAKRLSWLPDDGALPDPEHAKTALVSRYLSVFGPATHDDISHWTGFDPSEVAGALRAIGGVEVAVSGWSGPRWSHADDIPHASSSQPVGAALLPDCDPVLAGYRDLSPWIAADRLPSLCDRAGNIGPTVWLDGRVVGSWGLTRSGAIAVRMIEEIDRAQAAIVAEETARLERALTGLRVSTSVWTPLARELWTT